MLPIKIFFGLNILTIIFLIRSIHGDCNIDLHPSRSPIYYKYFGSHKLKINTTNNYVLSLREEQIIEAYCATNFEKPASFKASNKLYIKCNGGYIYTSMASNRKYEYYSSKFECAFSKWSLYESSIDFTWCPFNVTSYILTRPKYTDTVQSSFSYEILAGICYDIYNYSIYSVYYTLGSKKNEYLQPSLLGEPNMEIKYLDEIFSSNRISENVYADHQFENWITHANYDFSLIIQHQNLYRTLNEQFLPLLDFVWWQNLRLYNWNHYINALKKHVESDNKAYDILAGVSGSVKAPIIKSCSKNYTMEEVVFNTNRYIPLYVWNYLQDNTNSSNAMVVIGFNSPFNEFYSQDDVIFCPDKCQEIPWLKGVSSYFRYGIMGIVFCCDVEAVRYSKRLHDFPETNIKLKFPDPNSDLPNVTNHEPTELNDNI